MKQKKLDQENEPESHSTSSSKNYKIFPTDTFRSEAKKLVKKYPSIKDDFMNLKDELKKDPITGNDYMGRGLYKVRMAISGKGQGQSGGARVIIEVEIKDREVYVLHVYDKSYAETLVDEFVANYQRKNYL